MRPLIFISNDDGIFAKGLEELIRMVRPLGEVVVVAPESGRSGSSMSITSTVPVSLTRLSEEDGLTLYTCSGTPVDCVKLGLEHAVCRKPDLVLSGINHGDNSSVNVLYSGTMGVAFEGCLKQIPSIGFSLCTFEKQADFSFLEEAVQHIVGYVLEHGLPSGVCLNVNFPVVELLEGLRVCRMTKGDWSSEWVAATHPHGKAYYWLTGTYRNDEPDAQDTDQWAIKHGYGAITPVQTDVTAYDALAMLNL